MAPAPRALPVIKRSRLNEIIREVDAASPYTPAVHSGDAEDVIERIKSVSFVCSGPEAPHPFDPTILVHCPATAAYGDSGSQGWGCEFDQALASEGHRRTSEGRLVLRIEEDV